jgi:hypothetical protein
MANPTLHWRMLPPAYISTPGNAYSWLEALYKMGTSTTYADGTARSPGAFAPANVGQVPLLAGPTSLGTGSAWTWNYDATTFGTGQKTCCYAYPPSGGGALNQMAVFGGTSNTAGANWKQLYSDSRQPNYLYAGSAKNTGLYGGWNNPTTPFSAGDFTGFAGMSFAPTNYNILYMWESEEALVVHLVNGSVANQAGGGFVGAFVDPLSTNTANAETDGRLYGLSMTGSGNYASATWLSQTTANGTPLYGATTADWNHFVTFTPGAGTVVNMQRFGTITPSNAFTSRNGDLPQIPYQVLVTATGQYAGQLRQIFVTKDANTGSTWQVGSTVKGYLFGTSGTATTDAVLLAY